MALMSACFTSGLLRAATLARRHQEDTQPQANLGVDPAVVVNAQLIRPPDY
jgi:hypothetical protein